MTLDKQKESGYNLEKEAKLVWVMKVLRKLTEESFCGNVQVNFHQGVITGIQITDFKKPPV